jgi:hypothetical protein
MGLTKTDLLAIRKAFKNSVKDLEKEFGIELNIGNISYNNNSFSTKLKGTVTTTDDGNSISAEEVEFGNLCFRYGLTKDDYKKKIIFNGKTFILTGFKPRSTKYPIIATNISNGTSYKLPKRALA